MSQGIGVKGSKDMKKVSVWSMEEMRTMPNIAVEEDTEETEKWRGLSQSEIDQSWKSLAERMEESWTSTRSKKGKKRLSEVEVLLWNGEGCAKATKW